MVTKNALTYCALFLITISLIGYIVLKNSSQEIIHSSEKNLLHSADLIQLQFSKYIEGLRYDIKHISQSPYLHEYLDNPDSHNRKLLTEEYLSLLGSKNYFSQIRFIGIENQGTEVVRVERRQDSLLAVTGEALQIKGHRDYFIDAIQLHPDSMYISKIDLNKEHDKISEPYTPTLRVAHPVYQNGSPMGIIVINTNLTVLFESLEKITNKAIQLSIVDGDAHYVYHHDNSLTFGFEFNKPAAFKQQFGTSPQSFTDRKEDIFNQNDQLFTVKSLGYPRSGYEIYFLLSADKNIILASYYAWRKTSFFVFIALGFLSLLLAYFYMKRQATQLTEITQKINDFPRLYSSEKLKVNRKDEIGALAKSFNEMSSMITDNVNLLEEARLQAENAVKEKEEFLENMSHEIRNPLQSIIGLSDILQNNNPLPHQESIIKSIKLNSSNLNSLVTDILDYNKMMRSDIQYSDDWFPIKDMVRDILASNSYFAISKKINLNLSIQEDLENTEIFLDKIRLNQVINNLIVNAIKFSSTNTEVALTISKLKEDDKNPFLRFSVSDQGIGMDNALINRIKKRYYSITDHLPYNNSFGLGLNIVIELLKHYNSELSITSQKDIGSVFSFDIACPIRNRQQAVTKNNPTVSDNVFARLNMLIIDDDSQIIELYHHIFADRVSSLQCIQHPEELDRLQSQKYDVIITDFKIGKTTVIEFWKSISRLQTENCLIYVITALGNLPGELQASNNPMRLIQKPFDTNMLIELIRNDILASKFGIPQMDSIKTDYDNEIIKYTKAFQLLLSEWQLGITQLLKAIEEEDFHQITELRHKIITTVRRLDLNKFESILESIEVNIKKGNSESIRQEIEQASQFYTTQISKILY